MNLFMKVVLALLVALVAECGFAAESHLRDDCSPWLSTFYEKPLRERIASFDSYSLDNQYQIFICGNQMLHPPAIYLARPFAGRGEIAVPLLKAKLMQASDDLTIRDIVRVFVEMKRLNTYDASKDSVLAALISRKVAGMHDSGWRDIAQKNVNEILGTK
jgi:hypothetical protein